MKNTTKAVVAVGLLFLASGKSKAKKGNSSSQEPNRPESPPPTPRPEASKVPPKEAPRLSKGQSPEEKKGKANALKEKKAGRGQKVDNTPREKNAKELAADAFKRYLATGEETPYASADALTLYLLLGGEDAATISFYQHGMGIDPQSGWYDKLTSGRVVELLDPAVDAAVSQYQFSTRFGEPADKAAAEALAVYQREASAVGVPVPKERLTILQSQFMPPTGAYDDETKAELVKRGVVPP